MQSVRVIVASALALGLALLLATLAWGAPVLSIVDGPSGPTRETTPQFTFNVDETATSVQCSIDQGTEAYEDCTSPYAPASPLGEGAWTFRVRASDGVDEPVVETRSFSVDRTAPSLTLDPNPAVTKDTTPSLGFAVDGSATSVQCSVDQGTEAYEDCTSPYAPTGPLAEGSYTFRVRAVDALGNERIVSRTLVIDTTPPTLSIDSGPDRPTNDSTPRFGFTTNASRVECSVDRGSPAYATCSSPYTSSPLTDGSYTFRVLATDRAGNQTSAERTFAVDATPPSLTIDSGPDGPTNDRSPDFGFSAGGDAASVECSVDQGSPSYGPCSGSATHAPAVPLDDGRYTFRVRAADALGNTATRTRLFSVDSTAPSLTIDAGPPRETNETTPSFGFTTDAPRVECSVDAGAYGPCTSPTTYVIGTPLAEGVHTFRVQATSSIGNHAVQSLSFTVDVTPPTLSITFGPAGTTGDSTPLFQFAAEADATVACSLDQGTPAFGPCASTTAFAAIAPLADGAYTFRVRATDRAGNETVATRAFTVDTVPDVTDPGTERPDPTPPRPQLLSPFPLVRISGTLTSTGVRIRLLTVRAPSGTLVRVTVTPPCRGRRRSSRRCRVLHGSATVGRRPVIGFRKLARSYRSGTVIVVLVSRADRIGKYTRFTIVRGKAPRRVDQCLLPEAARGSRCPSD